MTDYTQEQLADELDQLAVEVGHEAVAENTAAMHEALAIGRVATGVTSPNVLTWREAAKRLKGATPRHSPDASVRDTIYRAHRFRCVSCGEVGRDGLELGHMLSCHESRILAELVRNTEPLAVCRYDGNLVPQCSPCNGTQGSRSFSAEAAWDAMHSTCARERQIPWSEGRAILRLLSIAEARRQ